MFITTVQLKNFRCFDQATFDLNAPLVIIEGSNGSGKSSLLEAIHYACYLRSFRTYSPQELLRFDQDSFFIKVKVSHEFEHEVQVGFADKKRLVKIDQKPVSSYKQLLDSYRVITLTEDDVSLIKGSPEGRRFFLDQIILLLDPSYAQLSRKYKGVLENRNALLKRAKVTESYQEWSSQLWHLSKQMQEQRAAVLEDLQARVQQLGATYFSSSFDISLVYTSRMKGIEGWHDFLEKQPFIQEEESRAGRSLWGAHLDDITITWQDKKSRTYASRGQQKLIVVLLKIAHMQLLSEKRGSAVFLLDDFMTDFDQGRAQVLLQALSDLKTQLIFTCPEWSLLPEKFRQESRSIKLTI